MSTQNFKQQISGIEAIRKELALRFALFKHTRQVDRLLSPMTDIQKIEQELELTRHSLKACEADSVAETQCLQKIRQLEDEHFQLLSDINGERIENYTAPFGA